MKQKDMMMQPRLLTNHGDILESQIHPDIGVPMTEESDMVRNAIAIILTVMVGILVRNVERVASIVPMV